MSHPAAPKLDRATVAIVGLGLMGSSLGLALAGRCARRVGVDVDAVHAARSLELGAVDAAGDLAGAVAAADVIVLCLPVAQVVALAPVVAASCRPDAVVTDVGSTKRAACDRFDTLAVPSVGGHPMCGRELSGPDAADAALYHGARWVLCRTSGTTPDAWRLVSALVEAAGAEAVELDRDEHDRRVAQVSHLPYLVAQALALTPDDAALGLASTGFAGATRLARGDVRMWRDVLATNGDEVRAALARLRSQLDELDSALDDPAAVEARLQAGFARVARLPRA